MEGSVLVKSLLVLVFLFRRRCEVMKSNPPPSGSERLRLQAALHRDVAAQRQGYRARALALFSHVCARCGREFSGRRLRELTVHHKDHDFKNNPPDGSNWELLCLYCHDHEHEKYKIAGSAGVAPDRDLAPSIFSPFAALENPPAKPGNPISSQPDH